MEEPHRGPFCLNEFDSPGGGDWGRSGPYGHGELLSQNEKAAQSLRFFPQRSSKQPGLHLIGHVMSCDVTIQHAELKPSVAVRSLKTSPHLWHFRQSHGLSESPLQSHPVLCCPSAPISQLVCVSPQLVSQGVGRADFLCGCIAPSLLRTSAVICTDPPPSVSPAGDLPRLGPKTLRALFCPKMRSCAMPCSVVCSLVASCV